MATDTEKHYIEACEETNKNNKDNYLEMDDESKLRFY